MYVSVADFPSFTQNFTLTRCSTLMINMILAENKNTIHFKQRLLPNNLPHDLEIVTVNGGESTSQYYTELAVAKFTGKRKKNPSSYFIATPLISVSLLTMARAIIRRSIPGKGRNVSLLRSIQNAADTHSSVIING